jgi:hypothetical protein
MTRTILSSLAVAAMLSMTANRPATAQGSGLYDFPGGYAGRFDGVSPGAEQKGGIGANETLTVGGNRTTAVGAQPGAPARLRAKRRETKAPSAVFNHGILTVYGNPVSRPAKGRRLQAR